MNIDQSNRSICELKIILGKENTTMSATIVIDLDGTLTIDDATLPYSDRLPNLDVVNKLILYVDQGYKVAIYTARNMKTHEKSIGTITAVTVPVIIEWLNKHGIPFHEIYIGKPWAEEGGFYVDDRAIRPSEFVNMTHAEIMALTGSALQ